MAFSLISTFSIVTTKSTIPAVLVKESSTNEEYIVVSLKTTDTCVAVVANKHLLRDNQHWCFDKDGYAGGSIERARTNMHQDVFRKAHGDYMAGQEANMSIDHINNIVVDNRISNLRLATRQEQGMNRNCWSKSTVPLEIQERFGITSLPRALRFDSGENKFTFSDHMLAARYSGVATGTKSSKSTHLEKLVDSLKNYIEMLDENRDAVKRPSAHVRHKLANEFMEIVAVANQVDPVLFPIPVSVPIEEDEYEHAQRLLTLLSPFVTRPIQTGPSNLDRADYIQENTSVCVRSKGDCKVVFDAKYTKALENVNWDSEDMRIHIHAQLTTEFPTLKLKYPSLKKIHLMEFIYTILEGNDVLPPTQCLIPYNNIRQDVRVANIEVATGTYRNFKPCLFLTPPPGIDIGMPYLPKNVRMTTDGVYPDQSTKHVFVVNCGKLCKVTTKSGDAKDTFEKKVVKLLAADWKETHMVYSALIESYNMAVEK